MKSKTDGAPPSDRVPLRRIFTSFLRVGALLFGGGYAMLPLLEREVAERRRWCTREEMDDYYAMAQLVPGVVAVNTAMLLGHRLRGFWGSAAATAGVVCVPFWVILAYAAAAGRLAGVRAVEAAMAGLRPAVAGLMLGVAFKMLRRSARTRLGAAVALGVAGLALGFGVGAVQLIVGGVAAGLLWHLAAQAAGRKRPGRGDLCPTSEHRP